VELKVWLKDMQNPNFTAPASSKPGYQQLQYKQTPKTNPTTARPRGSSVWAQRGNNKKGTLINEKLLKPLSHEDPTASTSSSKLNMSPPSHKGASSVVLSLVNQSSKVNERPKSPVNLKKYTTPKIEGVDIDLTQTRKGVDKLHLD
jgi:ribonuclease D